MSTSRILLRQSHIFLYISTDNDFLFSGVMGSLKSDSYIYFLHLILFLKIFPYHFIEISLKHFSGNFYTIKLNSDHL